MEEAPLKPKLVIFCVRFTLPLEQRLLGFAEACLRLTPRLALRGSEALYLDLTHLPNDRFATLPTRLRWLAKRFELPVQAVTRASSARAAWLKTHSPLTSDETPIDAFSISLLPELLDPFEPDTDSIRAAEKMIPALQTLGILSLSHFAKLPARKLSSRFGKLALFLQNAIQLPKEPWPVFLPPERLCESFQLTDPETQTGISGTDSLLYVLKQLGERLFSRLRGRALRASALRVTLQLENQEKRTLIIRLLVPQSSILSCLPTLRERLSFEWEQRTPLPCPATEIHLEVTDTAPGAGAQNDFFSREEREAEAQEALILRLQEKLGSESTYQAELKNTHWPERGWRRTPATATGRPKSALPHPNMPTSTSAAKRPSRILGTPVPAPRDWRTQALRVEGPERILAEWWEQAPLTSTLVEKDRDYYRVLTPRGERLWLFVTRTDSGEERAWIQGWFD